MNTCPSDLEQFMKDVKLEDWRSLSESFKEVLASVKSAPLTCDRMVVGGRYNWKNQSERLVYLGYNWSGNGRWHQFEKADAPGKVWCEVQSPDLAMFEETQDESKVLVVDSLTLITDPKDFEYEIPSYIEPKKTADWKQHNSRGRHKANARNSKKRK